MMKILVIMGCVTALSSTQATAKPGRPMDARMLCTLALTGMLTVPSSAKAVEVDFLSRLDQRLQNVQEEKRQILRSLEPGTFRDRYLRHPREASGVYRA